eukprot:CAMPEP_0185038024 /NCGR_PEP_ID=MMETSP1103-20130426/33154_1 /TAXON_ID=36769 /ORGANISM="Paraphysomonas bandaiensis, Strain Caron Lab Isolate" /LENGTH=198 /DNA_ID=CAMNT_0027576269 /DNA_START=46 /DNA_END=639 /DNA_ORIENTATION=+
MASIHFYHEDAYHSHNKGVKQRRKGRNRNEYEKDLESRFRSTSLNSTNWRPGHKNRGGNQASAHTDCWRNGNRKSKERNKSKMYSQPTYYHEPFDSYKQFSGSNCLSWCNMELDNTDFDSYCVSMSENEFDCGTRDRDLDDSLSIIYENCENALNIHAECIAIKAVAAKQIATEMWLRSRTPEERVQYIQHRNAIDPQ